MAKSVPDGHTILLGTIALVVNPSLTAKMPFDTLKDLAPVTRAADSTNILVVHPAVAAKSVKELIDLAKSKPLNAGSSGIGGTGHLAVELFNLQAGVKLTHVPYKGGGPAIIDLLAGNIQLIFATGASSVAHIKSGKIRALAVTTLKRSALMPELPTIAEVGTAGLRSEQLECLLRSLGHAAPHRQPAQQGPHGGAVPARHQGVHVQPGPRRRAGHARSARRLHEDGNGEVGEGDQGGGIQPQ